MIWCGERRCGCKKRREIAGLGVVATGGLEPPTIGVHADTGLVHTVTCTLASVADVT